MESPGAGAVASTNDWEAGESPTGVTNSTAGSAAISALGGIPNPNQSCQSTDGSEPTGAADVLGPAKLWARRSANSRGSEMVCDVTPRKYRGGGLGERERPRGGKNCPSEPSGSTSGRSNIELEIAVAERVGVGDELDVTTGSAPSAAEGVSATRGKLGRGGISEVANSGRHGFPNSSWLV